MRTAASIKALTTLKDITPELAVKIRFVWKDATHKEVRDLIPEAIEFPFGRMLAIDKIGDFGGVEFLGFQNGRKISYCNSGDTYTPTIVFINNRLSVCDIGSIIERGGIKSANEHLGY